MIMKQPSSSATLAHNHKASNIRDFVYSSESKARDQFTLKNMLSMKGIHEEENPRNFQSQQSEKLYRSNSRPNTMYGQRVRMFLQDENKRTKMQTEIKMKRQQSSHKVNRCSSGVEKQASQEEKIKMKKALGKINLLAEGVDLGIGEEEEIEAIFFFLECLAEINNHYQEAFAYISARLKSLVFAEKTSSFGRCIKQYVERNKNNQLLFNFVYRSLGRTSYQSLAEELSKEIHRALAELDSFKEKEEKGEQDSEMVIKEKQELIRKLKKELKFYQGHPSQDLYPYINKLEMENGQMGEEIDELVKMKDDFQYRIQIYENTNMLLSEQIQTLKDKIYEFELEDLSGMKEVEKNSELKDFEDNLANLRAIMDKSKLKMEGMRDEFHKIKTYNQDLLNERSKLAKRAAVGFGELTPRPQVRQIFFDNNLNFEQYFPPSKKDRSTEDIMRRIVSKLGGVSEGRERQDGQEGNIEKEFEEVMHDGDEMMQEAFKEMERAKEQIRLTAEAAEGVKKAYNKQKKDREELEKVRSKNY